MYIDGKLETIYQYGTYITIPNNSTPRPFRIFDWSTDYSSNAAYRPCCSLNDVRLYDHCLSPKEVSEIAKGLVLHYPLSRLKNANLITTMSAGGRTTLVDAYTIKADYGANTDTYCYFNVSPALELDKTYTLSFDVNDFPTGGSWNWRLWNSGNYNFNITGNGHWTYTFTPTTASLPSDYSLTQFLFDDGARGAPTNTVTFSNFKIESGNADTPWIPHSTNANYSSYITTTVTDESGFGNHGTYIGNLTAIADSPRYKNSCVFDGSTTGINLPIKNLMKQLLSDKCTINFWVKEANTSSRSIYFGGYSGSNFNIEMTGGKLRVYWSASPDF